MLQGPMNAEDFEGMWRLARRIDDRHAGQAGAFDGDAVFVAAPGGLDYAERGTLILGQAAPLRAERQYQWRFDGPLVAVRFDDGRAFHHFDLGAGRVGAASARHACGADMYDVIYDFARWPEWRAVWEVRGPRKNYAMTSIYTRAEAAAMR